MRKDEANFFSVRLFYLVDFYFTEDKWFKELIRATVFIWYATYLL